MTFVKPHLAQYDSECGFILWGVWHCSNCKACEKKPEYLIAHWKVATAILPDYHWGKRK